MAMDSHDEYYELQIIDTDNNNLNGKSNDSSLGQDGNSASGPHVSSSAVGTLSGSSKRKQCSLSKGLTIEEFLKTVDQNNQLTAIDKLILKNKAALAEDQMKRVRVKSTEKTTASQKKSDRKSKAKVVNSKNGKPDDTSGKNKTNGVKAKNSKPIVDEKSKKTARSVTNSESKNRTESRPSETRTFNGDHKSKTPKKQASADGKGLKSNEKAAPARKTLLQSVRKSRREPKVNCKSFDMKRLKSNVAYRTRSVNNEKLRNGKTRIIRSLPDETLLETKKKLSRSKDGTSSPGVTPVRNSVLKRPIKQEPREEDGCPGRKRKSSAPCIANSTEDKGENTSVQNTSRSASVDERLDPELAVKEEPHGEDIKGQSDINVSENESYSISESANCTSRSENSCNVPEATPVSSGLLIENHCPDSVIKEEKKETSLINPVDDEGSHADDTSESLNLQLDNLDDDLEMEVDDQSCTTETESIMDEMNEESSNAKQPNSQPSPDDSTRDSIFSALGLQSIERNNQKPKLKESIDEIYRGTLKMVIKTDNGCRRMEMKRTDNSQSEKDLSFCTKTPPNGNDREILNTSPTESSGSSGMSSLFVEDDADTDEVKTMVSEVPTVNIVEEVTSIDNDNQIGKNLVKPGSDKSKGGDVSLVVPEKSSSFSIHPDRLCSDVCNYCRGKFGLLDTPCHVGQLKNLERQRKILSSDPNVQIDTCLCDGCFRHVIHKIDRQLKEPKTARPVGQRKVKCAVQGCEKISIKYFSKRKWRSKLFRKFSNLSFDFGKKGSNAGHGLCAEHFDMMDLYTLCGICKKRLSRNEMYSIQSEVNDLNIAFVEDGIPVKLAQTDNMLVCKYCHHCMSLRLNFGDPSQMSANNRDYYESFKKEILRSLRGSASNGEQKKSPESQKSEITCNFVPEKANRAKESVIDDHSAPNTTSSPATKQGSNTTTTSEKNHIVNNPPGEQKRSESEKKRTVNVKGIANVPKPSEGEKSDESNKNQNVGIKDIASWLKPLESEHSSEKNSTHIQLKFGNLNIGKLSNLNIGQNTQSMPAPEKKKERTFGEAELPLKADFSFDNDDPSRGWERCVSTIQFDKSTKKLWQDLQKPYGNQSSFIRHLIMLEKYWRSGALVLSDSADPGAIKYISSVKNRIESLEVSSAPKLPPVPALAPAPALPPATAPVPIPQKPVMRKPEKLILVPTPTPPPLQPAPRPPQPPPLLKLTCLSPFLMRKTTPVCTVRPSPEFNFKSIRTSLPAPPKLERIPNVYLTKPIPNTSNRGTMQPQIHVKQHIVQMDAVNRGRTVTVMKKPQSLTNGTNSGVRAYSPQYVPRSTAPMNVSSSVMISKLPKALTVTQIDDVVIKDRKDAKSQSAAPFLAGEKPSVTVFREVTK